MSGAKVLLLDIETSPLIAYVWQQSRYNANITNDMILKDTNILSFAAKWLGSKEIQYQDLSNRKDKSNDLELLGSLRKLLDEADIVVAHNGRAFDIPLIEARFMLSGIKPPSPFEQVDTCRIAKKRFNFTSNKLEFLSEILGEPKYKHREFPGIELWHECLKGNPKAWQVMRTYNIQDVKALETLYLAMRPWIDKHPNVGMYVDSQEPVCPNCGGEVQKRGTRHTNTGTYQLFHCSSCGKYPRGRKMLNSALHRTRQLAG